MDTVARFPPHPTKTLHDAALYQPFTTLLLPVGLGLALSIVRDLLILNAGLPANSLTSNLVGTIAIILISWATIGGAYICYVIARSKRLPATLWTFIGLLTGIIGVFVIHRMPRT